MARVSRKNIAVTTVSADEELNKNVEIVFLFKNEIEELTGAAREAERKERNIG